MTAVTAIRVLLADDHETVREGIKAILRAERDIVVVGEADTGARAVAAVRATRPDLVVMDISMPDSDGVEATREIVQAAPGVHVVVFTRHADRAYLQELLHAGASGYVLKQSRAAVLINAIRAVTAGTKFLDPAVTGDVIDGFNRRPPSAIPGSHPELSEREEAVLQLVAWGHGNKEIAAKLALSVKTVETHKANAMQKLGSTSRIDVVRYALLRGWLHEQ